MSILECGGMAKERTGLRSDRSRRDATSDGFLIKKKNKKLKWPKISGKFTRIYNDFCGNAW